MAHSHTRPALFVVGAATLLLLFVGIHNAWDAVTPGASNAPMSTVPWVIR